MGEVDPRDQYQTLPLVKRASVRLRWMGIAIKDSFNNPKTFPDWGSGYTPSADAIKRGQAVLASTGIEFPWQGQE